MSTLTERIPICLIGSETDAEHLIKKTEADQPVQVFRFGTFQDFKKHSSGKLLFSGIVIESKMSIRLSHEDRSYLKEAFVGKVPIFEVSLGTTLHGNGDDQVTEKIFRSKWQAFLKETESYSPRGLRSSPRKFCVVKAEICPANAAHRWDPSQIITAVTVDVSRGGCFIVSPDDWKGVKEVYLRLDSMPEPIVCRVAWARGYHQSKQKWPGVGLEFVHLTAHTKMILAKLFENMT